MFVYNNFCISILKYFQAKNTLLDEEERKFYDTWLDSGITISFKNWRGLKGSVKTSMHWAAPKTDRMIKNTTDISPRHTSLNQSDKNVAKSQGHSSRDTEQNRNLQSKTILPAELSAEEREKNEKQEDSIAEKEDDNDDPDDGITYDPTQYEDLRYRMDTPPPDWEEDHSKETSRTASHNASQTTDKQNEMESTR